MFSGSLVAIVTPMRVDGTVDAEGWSKLLDFHIQAGTAGIVVGGSTGESATLSEDELRTLIETAVARCRGVLPIIAGAGTSSTAVTVERARWMSTLGVAALLVVTPAYNRPTQEGLYRHFAAVADVSSVPVILYNVPGRTAVDMQPETVGRLAEIERIVGIKEAVPAMERVRSLITRCRPGFAVLSGDDSTARSAILAGAHGVISVTANVAPRLMAEMVAAARREDTAESAAIDARLALLHRDLSIESNPIPAKWALAEMGLIASGIRLPLTPLSATARAPVRAALVAAGALPA